MGYVRTKPRRMPAQQKQEKYKREECIKEIAILRQNRELDLWFYDETGFEGDSTPRYVWNKKGLAVELPYYGTHMRTSITGAVRPRDGEFFSLILPYVDTDMFQLFIDEFHAHINASRRNIVVLDNASWHKAKRLQWGKLKPLFLPPYSPDLNPIEQLWRGMKESFFSCFYTHSHDELDDHIETAVKYFMDRKHLVRSICAMNTFK